MNVLSLFITLVFGLGLPSYIGYLGWKFTGDDIYAQTWVIIAIGVYILWLLMAVWWAIFTDERPALAQDPKALKLAWKEFQGHLVEIDEKTYRMESAGQVYYPGSPQLPHHWLENFLPLGQPVLVTLGLLGTFFGLALGLSESIPRIQTSDTATMQEGMNLLLGGAQTAFSKSFTGIGLGLCWMVLWRDIERCWHRDVHALAARLDKEYPFLSAQRHMLGTLMEVRTALSSTPQQEFSRIADTLTGSFSQMLDSQQSLTETLTNSFKNFDSTTIGKTVVDGVKPSLDELTKAQKETNEHTRELLARQVKTDDAVTQQLEKLVTELRHKALEPLGVQIQAVAGQVSTVAGQLKTSTESVNALAGGLKTFQTESLGRLEGFSRDLQGAVRELSDNVVGEIRNSLGAQTATLKQVGKESSELIRQAGTEAAGALDKTTKAISEAGEKAADVVTTAGEGAARTLEAAEIAIESAGNEAAKTIKATQAAITAAGNAASDSIREASKASVSTLNQARDEIQKAGKQAAATMTAAQTAITNAGTASSRAITDAGGQAATTLKDVQNIFGDSLRAQQDTLSGILTKLEEAYKNEINLRKDYTKRTEDAIKAVKLLDASLPAVQASINNLSQQSLVTMIQAIKDAERTNSQLSKTLEKYLKDSQDQQIKINSGFTQIITHLADLDAKRTQQQQALRKP